MTILQSALAFIVLVGGAFTYLHNASKPLRNFGKEHETLKRDVDALKKKVDNKFDAVGESNKILMKSILALMNAQLDGDATVLKKNIKEIQDYLIDSM